MPILLDHGCVFAAELSDKVVSVMWTIVDIVGGFQQPYILFSVFIVMRRPQRQRSSAYDGVLVSSRHTSLPLFLMQSCDGVFVPRLCSPLVGWCTALPRLLGGDAFRGRYRRPVVLGDLRRDFMAS